MDINVIQKNINGFDFVEQLGDFINNFNYKRGFNEYQVSADTKDANLWRMLSAIGDGIGNVIYENVMNYLDNVSNVDMCKVKALHSMMHITGINYQVLEFFETLPVEVANLIDILSINKKYLLDSKTFKDTFISYLSANGIISNDPFDQQLSDMFPGVSAELSSLSVNETYIDTEKYNDFLYDVMNGVLSSFVYLKYADAENGLSSKNNCIYEYIQDELIGNQVAVDFQQLSEHEQTIAQMKVKYGVNKSFDQSAVVDRIENGYDSIENYTPMQQKIIEEEILYRQRTYSYDKTYTSAEVDLGYNITRYSYYRERKVKEYFKFIEDTYNSLITEQNIKKSIEGDDQTSIVPYVHDNDYFDIDQPVKKTLLSYDSSTNTVEMQTAYIDDVARLLASQIVEIADIRDQVKTQIRKSYMKGTFLLMSYVINEFLKYSVVDKYGTYFYTEDGVSLSTIMSRSIEDGGNVQLIEYYDQTQYYNISHGSVDLCALNGETANNKFWDSIYGKIGVDTNDIPLDEIDNFYYNSLKLHRNDVDNVVNFLSIIYEQGSNGSFINKHTGEFTTLIPGRDIGDDPSYIGDPHNAISLIQNDILSVNKMHDEIDRYIEAGWIQTISDTSSQLQDLSTYVSSYYQNEISTANDSIKQQVVDYAEKSLDEALQIADKFDDISASYEQLKSNNAYRYYLSNYVEPAEPGTYFIDKLSNFIISANNPTKIEWKYSSIQTSVENLMSRYASLSNELYGTLFKLSVWQSENYACWPYYFPQYESELTTVTDDLKNYLVSQVQVQNDGALQHLQNHYDKLIGYKADLATQLDACNGAIAKYEAMRAGIEAASMTKMSEDYSHDYQVNLGPIVKLKYQNGSYVDDGLTDYGVLEVINISAESIQETDSIYTKLNALAHRSQVKVYTRLNNQNILKQGVNSPDKNGYFTTRTESSGHYTYTYSYILADWYDKDVYSQPWAGAYSQSTADEIIESLETAVTKTAALVTLINSELTCLGFGGIPYTTQTVDTICDAVSQVYQQLANKLDMLDNYIYAGTESTGWQSITTDSSLKSYKYRLDRIREINLSAPKACNIRYIDNSFAGLVNDLNTILTDNVEYFYYYANNDSDRFDKQLSAMLSYSSSRDSQCSAEVISAAQQISASYCRQLDSFNVFSQFLSRSEVTSVADDYSYNLSTIYYKNEVYNGLAESQQRQLDFLLYGTGGYRSKMPSSIEKKNSDIKLSGALYWLSSSTSWFEDSASQQICDKVSSLTGYIEMTRIINDIAYKYAPRIPAQDQNQLLIDKLDFIVQDLDKDIAHISSQMPLYDSSYEIYLMYNGTEIGYDPYYNYENQAYSSYQIHPYLYNFVEKTNIVYPFANNFFLSFTDDYEKILVTNKIDNIIGEQGNVKNVWRSGILDWTGYTSKYENTKSWTIVDAASINPLNGFTGLFFPPALSAFLADPDTFEQDVQDNSPDSYYYYLGLTDNMCQKIYDQLLAYYNVISGVANAQGTGCLSGEYDIYRYAEDCMGNQLFLLKSYKHLYEQHADDPSYQPSYHEKRNTLGELWMRIKGHPLAFPAFDLRFAYDDISQYSIKKHVNSYDKDINSYISSLNEYFKGHEKSSNPEFRDTGELTRDTIGWHQINSSNVTEDEAQHLRCFFDFEMDPMNQSLLLVVPYKTGTGSDNFYSNGKHQLSPQNIKFKDSSIVIGYLGDRVLFNAMSDQKFVFNFSVDTYPANNVNVDEISNQYMLVNGIKNGSANNGYFYEFIGFAKSMTSIYALFVQKFFASHNAFTFAPYNSKPQLNIIYYKYKCHSNVTQSKVSSLSLLYDIYNNSTDNDRQKDANGERIDYSNASNVAMTWGEDMVYVSFVTQRIQTSIDGKYSLRNTKILNFAEYSSQMESYSSLSTYGSNLDWPKSTALMQTTDSRRINIYNSFDSFVQQIVVVEFAIVGNKLKFRSTKYFNLNSDLGYLPQYADVPGTTRYYNNTALSGKQQYGIELLGPEKSDIDFTPVIETTLDEEYGRVVEEYKEFSKVSAFTDELTILANQKTVSAQFELSTVFIDNMKTTGVSAADARTEWDIISQTDQLLKYKYILYNTSYLAMPILKGNLSDVFPNGYFYQSSEKYDMLSGEDILGPNQNTYQNVNMTNHIDGISAVNLSVTFDTDAVLPASITLQCIAKNSSDKDRIIENRQFYMLLYARNTMNSYQYYHLFENANVDTPGLSTVTQDMTWSIDLAKDESPLSAVSVDIDGEPYYPFRSISKHVKYNELSASLEFKYSEENQINSEFPTINQTNINEEITIAQNDTQSIYFFALDDHTSLDLQMISMLVYNPSTQRYYRKRINQILPKYQSFYDRSLVIEATYNLENITRNENVDEVDHYGIVMYFNYKNFTDLQYVTFEVPDDTQTVPADPPTAYVCQQDDPSVIHTYLVLKPGESGRLDIRVDHVEYGKLNPNNINYSIVGAYSQILKSYYIMNVSDDKPKFIVSRVPFSSDEEVV